MATPTIDNFLGEIARIVGKRDGIQLQNYMAYEPPLRSLYFQIVDELKKTYSVFNQAPLDQKCKQCLPEYEEGDDDDSWNSFITFVVRYFTFLRDVDSNQLVKTQDMLKSLLKSMPFSRIGKPDDTNSYQSSYSRAQCFKRDDCATHDQILVSYVDQACN